MRLTKNPEAYRTLLGVFESIDDATNTISDIIGAGIVPAALELLDRTMLERGRSRVQVRLSARRRRRRSSWKSTASPRDFKRKRIASRASRKKNNAREVRKANTEAERMALWKARKQAFGTIGRLGYPSYCTQDGVVPRTKLPEIMRHILATAKKYDLGICNVFHAGDGNVHPILMFDERYPDQVKRVLEASHEILGGVHQSRRQCDR